VSSNYIEPDMSAGVAGQRKFEEALRVAEKKSIKQ